MTQNLFDRLRVVDLFALSIVHSPRDVQERALTRLTASLKSEWLNAYPELTSEDVDEMAAELEARIRIRRDEIEAVGVGSA